MSSKKAGLVCSVGINDADYPVTAYIVVNGKRKKICICPFYRKWKSMIDRCYSKAVQKSATSYQECSVISSWLTFSSFKAWMEQQDWEGKELDKDILFPGNKVYGPDSCVFVTIHTNLFITDRAANRGPWPIGVNFHKPLSKFRAQGQDVETGKRKYLGLFSTPEEAHSAWLAFKLEQAYIIAEHQTDRRVAVAIIDRYKNYTTETPSTDEYFTNPPVFPVEKTSESRKKVVS